MATRTPARAHLLVRRPALPADTRGFSLIELILVLVLIGVLGALSLAGYTAIAERQQRQSVVDTLEQIDLEARSLARTVGQLDPSPFLDEALPSVSLPRAEIDADELRIDVDEQAPGGGTVEMRRYGLCGRLVVDATGEPGRVDAPCP